MDQKAIEPVERFFTAFGQGDLDGLINTLEVEGPESVPVYRTYRGKEEARLFIETLGQNFQTQQFDVETLIGQNDTAMATGIFQHQVISTGKIFKSGWALKCKIKDDKITHYRFYENTAAAVEAFQAN